jgi:predicted ArsR family transcriptional regulator
VRREATPDEFRAMAHPLRLRILRLCLHEALTNKQIADRLGANPATVLHHVRLLVNNGFLRAERPRTGARGALEKPYRATMKSWTLSAERQTPDKQLEGQLAMVDSFRAELVAAGAEHTVQLSRFSPRLNEASRDELVARLEALSEEFHARDDADGTPYGVLIAAHRLA